MTKIITIVPFLAIFSGRTAKLLPEYLSKIAAGAKATRTDNLSYGFFAPSEHLTSFVQTEAFHILPMSHVQVFLEKAKTTPPANMGGLCQLFYRYWFMEMLMDIQPKVFENVIIRHLRPSLLFKVL